MAEYDQRAPVTEKVLLSDDTTKRLVQDVWGHKDEAQSDSGAATLLAMLKSVREAVRALVVSPADFTTADAYAEVTGSKVDTAKNEGIYIGFSIKEQGGANGITAEIQGSNDDATWISLTALDSAGAEDATADITITAGATVHRFITPHYDSGAKAAFRYYRVRAKSTVATQAGSARVRATAK